MLIAAGCFCPPIIHHRPPTLQSDHAGIRRKAGRTRALRDHDGRSARTVGGHDGLGDRRDVAGRAARRLLPEPALAGETGDGYSARDEESGGCEGTDPERNGGVEAEKLAAELRERGTQRPQDCDQPLQQNLQPSPTDFLYDLGATLRVLSCPWWFVFGGCNSTECLRPHRDHHHP